MLAAGSAAAMEGIGAQAYLAQRGRGAGVFGA